MAPAAVHSVTTQRDDLAQIEAAIRNPAPMANPVNAGQIIALINKHPDRAKTLATMLAASIAINATNGGPISPAMADRLSAELGMIDFRNTATGQAAELAESVRQARMRATATAAAQRIRDAAAAKMEQAIGGAAQQHTVVVVLGADGQPHYMTVEDAERTGTPNYGEGVLHGIAGTRR